MKLTKTKKIAILSGLAAAAALAQIPALIVHDPVGDISWVATATQAAATVAKLVQAYNQAVTMATAMQGTSARWQASIRNWQSVFSPDTFGLNGGWNSSMNTGSSVPPNFNVITTPLNTSMASVPHNFQQAAKLGIAAIERHDGLIQGNAMVIGGYSLGHPTYANSVTNLASSVTTNNASELTYAALQQKAAAAMVLQVQGASVGNELLKQLLQNSQAQLIMQRETATADVNQAGYVYKNLQGNLNANVDANSVKNLRIP